MNKIFEKDVNFNKGGGTSSGSSGRIIIPKELLVDLNITREENKVVIYREDDKIIIKKRQL
ncbi:antidote-toxin recognition MazE family protein [[Clostridium] bifermentans ATCC 638]|uniref:Antidote-toxin recognition MazE family protein n=1 Tax=Paraclostridium bifermentans ATCC 638 = DSM 14991 TaxID=1233171 RepID=T4V8D8_PARBF|nr:AbrB/MazE/SpoVT family DNA-binding domain-containing protein [Paraclostridium bifermentans]EQK39989.1 antidote-toxin recognition MazE family protein [[Clostridium] bifermentans ATCC 638] [Paraclostridium bifermentans ATCC 638 = DSM 14991]UAG19966.1 AbrB/MazE/SpoVT family DNA-binding domain-containing protein [Paraclostridium bifermentans]